MFHPDWIVLPSRRRCCAASWRLHDDPTRASRLHRCIEITRQMALTTAASIKARDEASEVRRQTSAAAQQGLANGLRAMMQPAEILSPKPM
jgi:hypothetical protein